MNETKEKRKPRARPVPTIIGAISENVRLMTHPNATADTMKISAARIEELCDELTRACRKEPETNE